MRIRPGGQWSKYEVYYALNYHMNWTLGFRLLTVCVVAGCALVISVISLGGGVTQAEDMSLMQATPTPFRERPGRIGVDEPTLEIMGEGMVVGGRDVTLPQTGRVQVMVELSDPPAAVVYSTAKQFGFPDGSANALAQLQIDHIDTAQQALLSYLTGPEIQATIMGRVQRVLNGIAIEVDASKLERILQLPGVIAIRPLRIGQLNGETPGPARPGRDSGPSMPVEPVGQLQ